VPELLLVPLYLGGKVPLGTLWIVADEEGHFDSGHARVMTEVASFVGIALRMCAASIACSGPWTSRRCWRGK
jgi:hypothetical protein